MQHKSMELIKKTMTFAIICTLSLGFTSLVGAADSGPAEIELKSPPSKKKPKAAMFPHKKHQDGGITCAECHHGKDGNKQVAYVDGQAIGKCSSCHNSAMANKRLNSFEKVAHANCKGCHKKEKAAGNKKASTSCKTCHPRKK